MAFRGGCAPEPPVTTLLLGVRAVGSFRGGGDVSRLGVDGGETAVAVVARWTRDPLVFLASEGRGRVRKRLRRWDLGFIVVRLELSSAVELDE